MQLIRVEKQGVHILFECVSCSFARTIIYFRHKFTAVTLYIVKYSTH